MFRTLTLAGLLTLGLTAPVTLPAAAEAHEGQHETHHGHFAVMYRPNCHCHWKFYGHYHHRNEAEHAAHHLRHQGYEVRIDCRD